MFSVGDKVKCINDGACYDSYDEWVKNNAPSFYKDYRQSIYHSNQNSANALDAVGRVVAIEDHSQYCDIELILVVTPSRDVFLIEERGLEHVRDDETSIS